MVIELSGDRKNVDAEIEYLENRGISVQSLEKHVLRDEKKCTHCSACVVHCPTKALHIEDRKP
ncbi:MAG: 4Fe-4S binding protein [Theionarchaea archaeon]|nr:4Fe-4S binding protein [Theionarchaea archaeon]